MAAFVSSADNKKKGKSAGITVLIHNAMPSDAPDRAVRESIMRTSIPTAAAIAVTGELYRFIVHHLRRIYAPHGKNITQTAYAFAKGRCTAWNGEKELWID
jgi:hypothetical protein